MNSTSKTPRAPNLVLAYLPLFVAMCGAAPALAANCSVEQGQTYIEEGRYAHAIREFTCLINAQPTEVAGYRGRIEAQVLLGEYSNAVRDYQRVTALVLPVHPDAPSIIHAGYAARLAVNPADTKALTGASFARWWYFEYQQAIHLLNRMLDIAPDSRYANLFRGSSRVLSGATQTQGVADLERGLQLDPANPHVRFIVADAYTYGLPDPPRAFAEANIALQWGLDTPRIRAILAAAYIAFGNQPAAAAQIQIHLNQVTTQIVPTAPLAQGASMQLALAPGRTYEIPLNLAAGQTLSVSTSSHDFWDTILVLLAPDGSPIAGSDDYVKYFAGLDIVVPAAGTYKMRVTSFESVNTGVMTVARK